MFLKISQNSQENNCAGDSFLTKLQAWEIPEKNAQKMKFSMKDFFCKCDQLENTDLVTFTIYRISLSWKASFFCAVKTALYQIEFWSNSLLVCLNFSKFYFFSFVFLLSNLSFLFSNDTKGGGRGSKKFAMGCKNREVL